jgi:hypothetical protein
VLNFDNFCACSHKVRRREKMAQVTLAGGDGTQRMLFGLIDNVKLYVMLVAQSLSGLRVIR